MDDGRGADVLREQVRARYAQAANEVARGRPAGCGDEPRLGQDQYSTAERDVLPDRAVAASLGCGNPMAVAQLRPGETVLDLGSGGGIDVLLSARRVGPTGKA
ncbi:MAG TPA: hypothetical protein VG253_17650, partial [Streptosporangiaceae bacterium]|nr:hypothetical protein [Streptosporangiaceae bacterium]